MSKVLQDIHGVQKIEVTPIRKRQLDDGVIYYVRDIIIYGEDQKKVLEMCLFSDSRKCIEVVK